MNKLMSYGGYSAVVEYDGDDEAFFGRILGIADHISFHAESVEDLKTAFHDAVDDYLETCRKLGKLPDKPYSGNLMLRVDPAVHSKVAMAAEASGKSLNQWGEDALRRAAEDQFG
jgi:predicted HicB family RNase H-like nuclease